MWWDLFSNLEGNYNVAVVGKSRSGKSVFMQELASGIVGSGGRVFILDVGRSFEKSCKLLGGSFIAFSNANPICINPFSQITDFNRALEMLKPVFATMASPSRVLTDIEDSLLEKSLRASFNQYGLKTTVTNVAWDLQHQEDSRAHDLATMLFPYTVDGMYGELFEGECELDFTNPYIVLELEELKERKDLQRVVLMLLMYHITENMYRGNRKERKACIIDEAWDLLGGHLGGKFIETGCRRAAKYNGAFITGTQSLQDYTVNAASKAAFANADWLVMLAQKLDGIEPLVKQGMLPQGEFFKRLLQSLKTKQGHYAEMIIKSPQGYGVSRLWLDEFSQVLYSSSPQDYVAIEQMCNDGIPLHAAISTLAKQKQLQTDRI
jgi:conjugal transfer ATP-binding protein TraC